MRPPMMKRAVTTVEAAQSDPPLTDSRREGYLEKVKLAQHLHDQGVNPLRWTEAHPAPQTAQQRFQETGRKTRDNQFDVDGRLYDWSPAVSASPAQAKALTEAYAATTHQPLAGPGAPVEALIDVDKVPLRHPLGTPHARRVGASRPGLSVDEERAALYRHYAKSGVDPDKAHLGDSLPMAEQEKLKAEIARLLPGDKTEISGLPMFYQGFDDGWIYQANPSTRENEEVQRIRRGPLTDTDGAANDNGQAMESAVVQHYLERDSLAGTDGQRRDIDSAAALSLGKWDQNTIREQQKIEQRDKGERDEIPEVKDTSPTTDSSAELQAATQNLPEIIAVIEKLQSDSPLTLNEQRIRDRISAGFRKAGIEFDYTMSDPGQLREVYAKAQEAIRSFRQGEDDSSAELAMAMLTLQGAQALAGGSLEFARILQADSPLEKLSLAFQRFIPGSKKLATQAATALNLEAAKAGPIDKEAAYQEFRNLFAGGRSSSAIEAGTQPSSTTTLNATSPGRLETDIGSSGEKMDAETFRNKLATFDEVVIHIGDVVLRQHPHTTATDQIFIEELLAVAQSNGCGPEPDPSAERPEKEAVYGGKESQRRITDIDQPGHKGSAQPDGAARLVGHGNSGEVWFNSVSTFADNLRILAREIVSAKRTLEVAIKQLGADSSAIDKLVNPVKARGHLFLYRKKWQWSLDKIREDLRSKIRKAFDQYYKDCMPIGPSSIIDLDGVE